MNRHFIQSFVMSLLFVAAGSVLVWCLLGCPATGIDDADIFLVYARNLAQGHGLVYNIGGEHVEGFTSMLWTILCSGFFRLTRHVEIPLYLFNLLLGAMTIWICLRRTRRPVAFLLLLAAMPAWFAWCQVTLMETGLWCLLLTLLVLSVLERRTGLVALLLPLLVITRPESMMWGAWLILMLGVSSADGDWKKGMHAIVVPVAVFVASLLALVVFRLLYFGFPVPNTFYAKVSPHLLYDLWNGSGYMLRYLVSNPVVFLAGATWVWVIVRGLRRWKSGFDRSTLMALCLLPGIGIPVLVGGDHFGGFRFYEPIWPLLCLLVVDKWEETLAHYRPVQIRYVLVALLLCGWVLFPLTARLKHEFRIAREGRETGHALATMFGDLNAYPTVATITAGGSKYAYPGKVYDLMGLNSTEMAHRPGPREGYKNHTAFNRDVFYEWQPDILLCGDSAKFDALVLKGLPSDISFQQLYFKGTLHRNGCEVTAYYLRDFLQTLPSEKRRVSSTK